MEKEKTKMLEFQLNDNAIALYIMNIKEMSKGRLKESRQ